jgi:predicted NUDIX family NTP pyrophosphohydrolase
MVAFLMVKQSAGILLYRNKKGKETEIFLVHPGGPFWAKKDLGAWSIPKGEFETGEDPLTVAKREFEEETGQAFNGNIRIKLQPVRLKSGKMIHTWAAEGNADENKIRSNTFEMEWPPRSGNMRSFPEIDKAEWFDIKTALEKINEKQSQLILELVTILS